MIARFTLRLPYALYYPVGDNYGATTEVIDDCEIAILPPLPGHQFTLPDADPPSRDWSREELLKMLTPLNAADFNRHIVGLIEAITEYRGGTRTR